MTSRLSRVISFFLLFFSEILFFHFHNLTFNNYSLTLIAALMMKSNKALTYSATTITVSVMPAEVLNVSFDITMTI